MSEYECTVLVDASRGFTVKAGSPEEAADLAQDQYYQGETGICHQCSRNIDLGEPYAVLVYGDGEMVLDTSHDAQRINTLTDERDALRAENDRLAASLSAIRDIVTTEHESKASFIARVRALLPPVGSGNPDKVES